MPESSVGSSGYNEFFRLLRTPGCKRKENLSVSGVLKRDGGTQLTWQMKLRHGDFEVLAVLERGNSTTPDADWARLQLRLAEHGVRMAPLATSGERASWYGTGRIPTSARMLDEPLQGPLPAAIMKGQSCEPGVLRLSAALATTSRNS
jgi:hypothetical protein